MAAASNMESNLTITDWIKGVFNDENVADCVCRLLLQDVSSFDDLKYLKEHDIVENEKYITSLNISQRRKLWAEISVRVDTPHSGIMKRILYLWHYSVTKR